MIEYNRAAGTWPAWVTMGLPRNRRRRTVGSFRGRRTTKTETTKRARPGRRRLRVRTFDGGGHIISYAEARRAATTEAPTWTRLVGARPGGSGPSTPVTSRRRRPQRCSHTNAVRAPRSTAPHQS